VNVPKTLSEFDASSKMMKVCTSRGIRTTAISDPMGATFRVSLDLQGSLHIHAATTNRPSLCTATER
jgi:hypothetical protein